MIICVSSMSGCTDDIGKYLSIIINCKLYDQQSAYEDS